MEKFEFYIETCFCHATISLTTSTGTSKPNLLTGNNKKTAFRQLPKKNDNEEESVTEEEDDAQRREKG